jgi:hypothetical protein
MYWRDIGYLCKETTTLDSMRKPQKSFTKREVFCNEKGVKRNEFYQAQAQGYKPELCVEIKESEFGGETHFEFREIMYRIIRTYPVKGENLEIICNPLVVQNGS